uniref:Uncharacterized protein n=1 Tax=Arundo donax TaxID=35708 RepID=A0A0A9FR44_ARUDO
MEQTYVDKMYCDEIQLCTASKMNGHLCFSIPFLILEILFRIWFYFVGNRRLVYS